MLTSARPSAGPPWGLLTIPAGVALGPMGSQCKARRRGLAVCQARSRTAAMGAQWPEPLWVASKRPRYGVALLAKGEGHWRRRAPCSGTVWTQRDPPAGVSTDPSQDENPGPGRAYNSIVSILGKSLVMNLEKVIFGFFIVLAATLNFGFFIGDIDKPAHHDVYELFAAIVVNFVATVLKFGDRTQIGAVHLSTSLVADLQLIAAAMVWGYGAHVLKAGMTPEITTSVVSLAGGALMANIVSVVILIAETIMQRR